MKGLVTGAGGILGTEFMDAVAREGLNLVGLTRAELDVTDAGAVDRAVRRHRPEVVLHCAAYTAVDRAESEPGEARRVNRDGTAHVAAAAASMGALMVYMSTDFVFDGASDRPYRPDDALSPRSVYGRTKLEGEGAVMAGGGPWLIVRTSWVYGRGGGNFVDAILGRARSGQPLRVVGDQTGRPTWARDLARGVLDLVTLDARGIWHLSGGGACTWLELAREALRLEGLDVPLEGVSTEAWGAAAPRPRYSVLDLTRTEEFLGRAMTPWPDALAAYLAGPASG